MHDVVQAQVLPCVCERRCAAAHAACVNNEEMAKNTRLSNIQDAAGKTCATPCNLMQQKDTKKNQNRQNVKKKCLTGSEKVNELHCGNEIAFLVAG